MEVQFQMQKQRREKIARFALYKFKTSICGKAVLELRGKPKPGKDICDIINREGNAPVCKTFSPTNNK